MDQEPENQIVEIDIIIHHTTDKAYLVSFGGEDGNGEPIKVWLPKSQAEILEFGDAHIVMIPNWLAQEKGMI